MVNIYLSSKKFVFGSDSQISIWICAPPLLKMYNEIFQLLKLLKIDSCNSIIVLSVLSTSENMSKCFNRFAILGNLIVRNYI